MTDPVVYVVGGTSPESPAASAARAAGFSLSSPVVIEAAAALRAVDAASAEVKRTIIDAELDIADETKEPWSHKVMVICIVAGVVGLLTVFVRLAF